MEKIIDLICEVDEIESQDVLFRMLKDRQETSRLKGILTFSKFLGWQAKDILGISKNGLTIKKVRPRAKRR